MSPTSHDRCSANNSIAFTNVSKLAGKTGASRRFGAGVGTVVSLVSSKLLVPHVPWPVPKPVLPKGEKNPLSARARSSQVEKRTVKIGVGLLPYVWIGSVWQKRPPPSACDLYLNQIERHIPNL
jgi:hypothetical protein